MLVIGRKQGKRVFVNGGEIIVSVIDIYGDNVRLGFEAPADTIIDREEIHLKKLSGRANDNRETTGKAAGDND